MPPSIQQTTSLNVKDSTFSIVMTPGDVPYVDASGELAGQTPVADGTYTVGLKLTGGGVDGTITILNGVVTAIQAAT